MDTKHRTLVQTTYDDLAVEYATHLAGELAGKPLDRSLLDRFAGEVRDRLLLAFHVGDEIVRPGELWGIPVALDWIFFQTEEVVRSLTAAGLTVTEAIERAPYEGVEHASRRAYVFATR